MCKDTKFITKDNVKKMGDESVLDLYERRIFIEGIIDPSEEGKNITCILKNEILRRMRE